MSTLFALRMHIHITLLGIIYISIDVEVVPINLVNCLDIKWLHARWQLE